MKQPSQLQLGVDIPISLQRVSVGGGPDSDGMAFLLVVPDIDAGGCCTGEQAHAAYTAAQLGGSCWACAAPMLKKLPSLPSQ